MLDAGNTLLSTRKYSRENTERKKFTNKLQMCHDFTVLGWRDDKLKTIWLSIELAIKELQYLVSCIDQTHSNLFVETRIQNNHLKNNIES